jgi:nucleotide-binding universal stress UspA family protein
VAKNPDKCVIMIRFERILVPVDYSHCSRKALSTALQFAELFQAHIDILHVYDIPTYMDSSLEVKLGSGQVKTWVEVAESQARSEFAQFMKELQDDGIPNITGTAILGNAVEQILSYAHEHGNDLIIMGTHGRSGLNRLLLGSVAERVIRSASCPVLTLRSPDKKEDPVTP